MRTSNIVEKNTFALPAAIIQIPANTVVEVLPRLAGSIEIAGRYIQNTGAAACFYAYNGDCTPFAYHGSCLLYTSDAADE